MINQFFLVISLSLLSPSAQSMGLEQAYLFSLYKSGIETQYKNFEQGRNAKRWSCRVRKTRNSFELLSRSKKCNYHFEMMNFNLGNKSSCDQMQVTKLLKSHQVGDQLTLIASRRSEKDLDQELQYWIKAYPKQPPYSLQCRWKIKAKSKKAFFNFSPNADHSPVGSSH